MAIGIWEGWWLRGQNTEALLVKEMSETNSNFKGILHRETKLCSKPHIWGYSWGRKGWGLGHLAQRAQNIPKTSVHVSRYPVTPLEVPDRYYLVAPLQELGTNLLTPHPRSALLSVLKKATSLGWRLVASADVSAKYIHQDNGPDYPIDVHSWYFVYWPQDTGRPLFTGHVILIIYDTWLGRS